MSLNTDVQVCDLAQSRLRGVTVCRLNLNNVDVASCLPSIASTRCGFAHGCTFSPEHSFAVGTQSAAVYTCTADKAAEAGFWVAVGVGVAALIVLVITCIVLPLRRQARQAATLIRLEGEIEAQRETSWARAVAAQYVQSHSTHTK